MIKSENLCQDRTIIDGKWYVAEPEIAPLFTRVADALSVLFGNAHALKFEDKIDFEKIMNDGVVDIIKVCKEVKTKIEDNPSIKSTIDKKLTREISKLGVSVIAEELKINGYTFVGGNSLTVSTDSGIIDLSDEVELVKLYETSKFNFVYEKIMRVYSDIKKNIDYMSKPDMDLEDE
jgi:hypothetical protein